MSFIRELPSGKSQIIKDRAFCTLLHNQLPPKGKLLTDVLVEFDSTILKKENTISKGALSNVHGDWYEWLLAISAWNFCCKNKNAHVPLLMPNISQFDVAKLYIPKLQNLIIDLRNKVEQASDVKLITSNPDFVILSREIFNKLSSKTKPINRITVNTIYRLNKFYSIFADKCDFEDIIGYLSVKTSLRPDRRLQIPHEGSLMKAIYTHLQTREWIINPPGLKFFAISTKINPADRQALKTVATHSITTVSSLPQAAVDDVYEINSINQANKVFKSVLFQ
ncbi:MAG: Cfr10I/Bse634I family restriction endonuclease [Mariniphaga sp.]|nr:Cfr10I/Bse634I family restriction endonuclease [Mariniphaga sp.]